MTHLCVAIFVTELAQARRDIAAAAAAGADMVELRIDKLRDQTVMLLLLADQILPAIVTCRTTEEGGFSNLDDSQRLQLLDQAIAAGAANVDLEFQTVQKNQVGFVSFPPKLILSFHDFQAKPQNPAQIIAQMSQVPAAVNKIVWKTKKIDENLDALKLLINPPRPTIALCMGEAGMASRILAKKFAAFLTFASLNADAATAPGQVTIAELKNLYRWDAINPNTKVYGVIGHPIGHSMSPAIHNAAFTATSHDGVYLPFLVDPDYASFESFVKGFLDFPRTNLAGLSVTIPHKENALRFLKENGGQIEELADRIGAVNTLVVPSDGKSPLQGKNTDYAAILDSITGELGIARDALANRRISILGAGGTARAAVAGLAHYGADIAIANRTHDRAQSLADEFNGHSGPVTAISFDDLCRRQCDIFINTTSVGMSPNIDQNPLEGRHPPFNDQTIVFDLIYNPMITQLLTMAEAMGANTISGVEMFCRQAAAQFESWTGIPAPREVMRDVIARRLGLPLHSR